MILRHIVVPLVTAYALFVWMAVAYLRRPVPRAHVRSPARGVLVRARAFREIVWTITGGYVVFLLIVLVFHVVIVGDRGALRSAATGGAFLAFVVATPVFVAGKLWRTVRRSER